MRKLLGAVAVLALAACNQNNSASQNSAGGNVVSGATPMTAATLSLTGAFDVNLYKPGLSVDALASYQNVSSLNLAVPDQMMVLRLTSVPEPASVAIFGICTALLTLRRGRGR